MVQINILTLGEMLRIVAA